MLIFNVVYIYVHKNRREVNMQIYSIEQWQSIHSTFGRSRVLIHSRPSHTKDFKNSTKCFYVQVNRHTVGKNAISAPKMLKLNLFSSPILQSRGLKIQKEIKKIIKELIQKLKQKNKSDIIMANRLYICRLYNLNKYHRILKFSKNSLYTEKKMPKVHIISHAFFEI